MNDTTNSNTTADRRRRLATARLYVLTDGGSDLTVFSQRISVLIENAVDIIQIREKRIPDEAIALRIERAIELILAANSPTLLIVNDRSDLAAKYPVDGVHVGQDDESPRRARSVIGSEKLLGISTHNIEQANHAVADGADYLGAGPTFPSQTKSFHDFPGLDFLSQISSWGLPIFAIGGIHIENIDAVLKTGITRVAVSNAVVGAQDMANAVRGLQSKLQASACRRP